MTTTSVPANQNEAADPCEWNNCMSFWAAWLASCAIVLGLGYSISILVGA